MRGVVEHRLRTDREYNLPDFHGMETMGRFDIPVLQPCSIVPDDLLSFNYATGKNANYMQGVHFYIDDYQFQRVWNQPENYTQLLSRFQCALTPDFSLYMDMPSAMKLWNVYRSRYLGAYWQAHGVQVIPTLQWADEPTFEYCFDGLPQRSVVSVSTLGVIGDPQAERIWSAGMTEALRRLRPSLVLLYGKPVYSFDFEGTEMIRYQNHIINRMEASHGRKRNTKH